MKRYLVKEKKEVYEKPQVETETVDMAVYGFGIYVPIAALQPFFGLCPPCNT